jgi:hypothetical protein
LHAHSREEIADRDFCRSVCSGRGRIRFLAGFTEQHSADSLGEQIGFVSLPSSPCVDQNGRCDVVDVIQP